MAEEPTDHVTGEGASVVDGQVHDPPAPNRPAAPAEREEAQRELAELATDWEGGELDARHAGAAIEQSSLWKDATRRFMRNKLAMISMTILWVMVVLSVLAPMTSKYTGNEVDFSKSYIPAFRSAEHPFGTDNFGRDQWTRAWKGGRVSLAIAFSVAFTILAVGVLYGSVAGYVGGRLDNLMMRFLDALYGLPYIPFAIIAILAIKEYLPSNASPLFYMVPALSIVTWFTAARIVRAQVMSLKENEYVEAARSAGARGGRIMFRHIVPNTFGVLVIAVFLEVPNAILGEALLSFLGLGVEAPGASWGSMASEGAGSFRVHPHLIYIPALLIVTTVLCAVAIADGLRDALDPRGRRN